MVNLIHPRAGHIINQIVLIAKYYIFQQKCLGNQYKYTGFKVVLKDKYRIQKYNAFIENQVKQMKSKWEPVLLMLQLNE